MKNFSLENLLLLPANYSDYVIMATIAGKNDDTEEYIRFLKEGMEANDPASYLEYGMYRASENFDEGLKILQKGANEFHDDGCTYECLAKLHDILKEHPNFRENNELSTLYSDTLKNCINKGPLCKAYYARMLILGDTIEKNIEEGSRLLKEAVEEFDFNKDIYTMPLQKLSFDYLIGRGVEQDVDKAIELLLQSATISLNADDCALVAKTLSDIDPIRSKRFAVYSATKLSSEGYIKLGSIYDSESSKDENKRFFAAYLYELAIKKHDVDGYLYRATMFLMNDKYGNTEKAIHYLEDALNDDKIVDKESLIKRIKHISESLSDNEELKDFCKKHNI